MAVQYTNDLDRVVTYTIQGEIVANEQMTDAGRDVIARRTEKG